MSDSEKQFVIIGLGSNLGGREAHLRNAVDQLAASISDIKESSIYSSPAMLPQDAPKEWDIPFLNMAISGQTELSPSELLALIGNIEKDVGRKPTGHWGPREIDLDILAYDQQVIDSEQLRIPHPGLLERAFVLRPMADIAPHWVYPRPSIHQGKTIHEIALGLLDNSQRCQLYKTTLEASA